MVIITNPRQTSLPLLASVRCQSAIARLKTAVPAPMHVLDTVGAGIDLISYVVAVQALCLSVAGPDGEFEMENRECRLLYNGAPVKDQQIS